MKFIYKTLFFIPAAVLLSIIDVPQSTQHFPYVQMVSEAHAVFGVRRRAVRRGVVIGSSMAASGAAAQQQAAPAPQQQAAPEPQQSAPGLLPMGKIVSTLPAGCKTLQVSGQEYYHCGVNYYRSAFQGNKLVYVTTQPD